MIIMRKALLATTVGMAAGFGQMAAASAAAVTSWQLQDFDSDGLISNLNFRTISLR